MSTFDQILSALRIPLVSIVGLAMAGVASAADSPSMADLKTKLPAEVRARAERETPAWRARIPEKRPRLFFTAETWRGLRERYRASTGQERLYFEAALARARQIETQPRPVYRTPVEMMKVDASLTSLSSQEELWERVVGNDMVTLSFALALSEDPKIRAKLHEMVLTACAYPQWGWPGLEIANRDLACGHVARGIAIAWDWHPDLWTEADRTLICATIRARVEALKAGAYGGVSWAGHYDVNHLQVSVGALGLCGVAFFDEIPEAAEWTALALTTFERVARESNADGTSNEGIPYWSYGLSHTLQYIEGVAPVLGTRSLYAAPFFRHSIEARLHASTPDLSGTLPWGDAVPRDYYGPHHMLYRLAAEYRDGVGQQLAAHLPFPPGGGSDCAVWTALWFDPSLAEKTSPERDHYSPSGGIVNTRSGWNPGDYLLSFKTGLTNVNHGHLDSGALAFCVGGDWLLKAPGYGKGKGEGAFWDRKGGRWNYFSNATESHSALLINGRNQRFTPEARSTVDSYVSSPGWMATSADLTGAYEDVSALRRTVLHRRGDYVLVFDEMTAPAAVKAEWLAQVPPDAVAAESRLTAVGKSGALEIRSLLPAGLELRTAGLHCGKKRRPGGSAEDFRARAKGAALQFTTALIPRLGDAAAKVRTLTAREKAGRQEIIATGADWQDTVTVDPAADAPARLRAERRMHDRLDSVLAIGAREVVLDGLTLRFKNRADLALQHTPGGAWEVDAGNAFELAAALPDGWQIGPDGGARKTPAGHYSLQPPKTNP